MTTYGCIKYKCRKMQYKKKKVLKCFILRRKKRFNSSKFQHSPPSETNYKVYFLSILTIPSPYNCTLS